MTKREIVLDWLSKPENREKLPQIKVSQEQMEAYDDMGQVYHYSNEESVICIGKTFSKIKKN